MKRLQIKYIFLISLLVPGLVSCASTRYYLQSVNGHIDIHTKKQPISEVLVAEETDEILQGKLEMVIDIRRFASEYLALPKNDSYTEYADLDRDFVIWNVFATPELSLEPKQWCFLFAGCLNYRGYFSKETAIKYAQELETQGYDVFVGGVAAYSTLGWFNDPVLNTMLGRDKFYLANVIFHELAHQKFYLKNDTAFNEAFAETVAQTGVQRWLQLYGSDADIRKFSASRSDEDLFVNLVLKYRKKLGNIYNSDNAIDEKRASKDLLLSQLEEEYKALYQAGQNSGLYLDWFSSGLNNAKLATVITYQDYVAGFLTLFHHVGGNYQKFYEFVKYLGNCDNVTRKSILEDKVTVFQC
ncbi:MAG: aminopeptidase [Pseudomonadota bacterium]|nr:aminopeptidase [Pseudomonadota bacterium]